MRVTRSFILLLGVAIAAAGCARQPVAYVAAPTAAVSPSGVDNVVYGSATPAPRVVQPYAAAPYATASAAAPSATVSSARGLFTMGPSARGDAPASSTAGSVAAPAAAVSSTSGLYAMVPSARGDAAAPATTGSVAAPPVIGVDAPAAYAYAPAVSEGPYTLDSGDRLRVVVFGQEGLTNSYAVDASGHIAMPLIGPVLARGATTDQLSNRIAEKLRDGFIREPHVAVESEAYRPFFILGEVTAPGQYPFVANMSVETAVAIAGGFTPRAFRKTVMLNRTLNGRQVRRSVPVTFPLRPGDTVNVQERWF